MHLAFQNQPLPYRNFFSHPAYQSAIIINKARGVAMSEQRMPTQQRAIEKRNRIIEKGFELLCEQGYYKTTIPDIAKAAGVSVGIIYQYFKDKKEIFLVGVEAYSTKIMYPMLEVLDTVQVSISNLPTILEAMIDNFIQAHTMSERAHAELMAMSYLDEDVAGIFHQSEYNMTIKIVDILEQNGIHLENATEKVHIVIGLIDNFCHEVVYHKHAHLNYNQMRAEVIQTALNILQ